MAAIGHHLEDVIALLRQRNTSTLCCPWRSSRDRTIQVKAERLMATTGQLFEELMATFHTLGIADPPLELHVLDVPGAHCLTVFTQGNVAASRKQVASALVTLWGKSPCEVAESVVGRPQNTFLWIGSEAEFQRCGQRWSSSQLRNYSVSAHLRGSTERYRESLHQSSTWYS